MSNLIQRRAGQNLYYRSFKILVFPPLFPVYTMEFSVIKGRKPTKIKKVKWEFLDFKATLVDSKGLPLD